MPEDMNQDEWQPQGHVRFGGTRENEGYILADSAGLESLIKACRIVQDEGELLAGLGEIEGFRLLAPSELPDWADETSDVLEVQLYPGHILPGGEYDDFLVGNTVGFENLMAACRKALETGEYQDPETANYIRVWETSWFEENPLTKSDPLKASDCFPCLVAIILFLGVIIYGMYAFVALAAG